MKIPKVKILLWGTKSLGGQFLLKVINFWRSSIFGIINSWGSFIFGGKNFQGSTFLEDKYIFRSKKFGDENFSIQKWFHSKKYWSRKIRSEFFSI